MVSRNARELFETLFLNRVERHADAGCTAPYSLMDMESLGEASMSRMKSILLVENSNGQGPTVRQALHALGVGDRVVQLSTCAEALEVLSDSAGPRPAVIIADASTQDADGLEVLRKVKADEQLKTIPVIIVAPSSDVQVIDESFALGVAGYVVKSSDLDAFVEAMRAVHEYWMLSESPVGR